MRSVPGGGIAVRADAGPTGQFSGDGEMNWWARKAALVAASAMLVASIVGVSAGTLSYNLHAFSGASSPENSEHVCSGQVSGAPIRLASLSSSGAGGAAPALLSASGVATWTMMVAGFASLGLAARPRRRTARSLV